LQVVNILVFKLDVPLLFFLGYLKSSISTSSCASKRYFHEAINGQILLLLMAHHLFILACKLL